MLLPSDVEDVPEPEPGPAPELPPVPEPERPDEEQGSQGQTAAPVQRFVRRYYAAVRREDWYATYSLLDSASRSRLAREEWVRKQRARDEARALPPIESAKVTNISEEGDIFTATGELTHQDGTTTSFTGFEMTKEKGKFRRHLTREEL